MSESPQRRYRTHTFRVWILQPVVAIGLVLAGVAAIGFLVRTRPETERKHEVTPPRLVRVFEATRGRHRCSARVFGTSRASRQWVAIAETRGEAIEVCPKFEVGEILPAGTLLVQIDPEDYRLSLRRYESEVRAREEQLNELGRTEANLLEIRQLQEEQLQLAQRDLERITELVVSGAVTEAEADAARTTHLARLLAFQETANSLTLIPVMRARAEAERDAAKVQIDQAMREIARCSIRLPFDARCAAKSVEENQYVHAGQQLGVFLDLGTAEMVLMVEARRGSSLFPRGIPGTGPLDLRAMVVDDAPVRVALALLEATVHWGDPPRRGKVTRIESTVDPATRTFPVIVEVAEPYSGIVPGVRPPLAPDVFCEVTLYGAVLEDVVVIPRDCLHELPGAKRGDEPLPVVYLLVGGDRVRRDGKTFLEAGFLKIQQVDILAVEDKVVILEAGLDGGDIVVVSDLYLAREHWGVPEFGPASEAMSLSGVLEEVGPLHNPGPGRDVRTEEEVTP